ncbi:MAG TPA: NRDE family protein [Labilithrix sp.]
MCTVVLASHALPGRSLVVVANRDEQLSRPARAPFVWDEGFLAPRDERAGGTWLGLNPHGVFVGITNRFLGMREAARRTRGEIVVRALAEPSARAVHARMRAIDPRFYNGFHLVYADREDVLATIADGETLAQLVLGRGVHAVTERSFGAGDDSRRLARIRAAWARGDLEKVLVDHDSEDPLAATCIHAPALDYGTRSAIVLELGDTNRMRWADGPPCTAPFVPVDLGKVIEKPGG